MSLLRLLLSSSSSSSLLLLLLLLSSTSTTTTAVNSGSVVVSAFTMPFSTTMSTVRSISKRSGIVQLSLGHNLQQQLQQQQQQVKFRTSNIVCSSWRTIGMKKTQLFGIRCENKYYQLEEMEDRENSTTELFLKEDGTVLIGKTDGPLFVDASGYWRVEPGTDNFKMIISKKFTTGSDRRDMGEFSFDVHRTFIGDMIHVGENVAITGVMRNSKDDDDDVKDVGFFNMIDATDVRLDKRADARPGVSKDEKDVSIIEEKNDATATHKGASAGMVYSNTASSYESYGGQQQQVQQQQGQQQQQQVQYQVQQLEQQQVALPVGWEEYYDEEQQRFFYVDAVNEIVQWERPQMVPSRLQQQQQAPRWEEHFDPQTQAYFYVDTTTGMSQWERPTEGMIFGQQQQQQPQQLPIGWEERYDQVQQRNYYVDTINGISQWENPLK